MSVGNHATDEVGLSLVEGAHQVVQLALEVGGHGLTALALLPVLVLRSLQGLEKERGVQHNQPIYNLDATLPVKEGTRVYSHVGQIVHITWPG